MTPIFIHRLEVRFRDCDAMGHVNNAVYLTYLEQSRFAHWRATGLALTNGRVGDTTESPERTPLRDACLLEIREIDGVVDVAHRIAVAEPDFEAMAENCAHS